MFPTIGKYIQNLSTGSIPEHRLPQLEALNDFIQTKLSEEKPVRLNFICTHNSRRSHFGQLWAQTLAAYFGIPNFHAYSAGTESTAVFPMVLETIAAIGFKTHALSNGSNPVYAIKYAENEHPILGFSKTLDDSFNPKTGFAAVMTCAQADEGCPFVPGAEKRISLSFDDPKAFDNTLQQVEKYEERSRQIATELLYVFQKLKK